MLSRRARYVRSYSKSGGIADIAAGRIVPGRDIALTYLYKRG